MKIFLKNFILFIVFGAIYFMIESIWKGHITHWSMFILAGFVGLLIGGINEYIPWKMPFQYQCFIGTIIAILGEGITGLIVNKLLNLNVWHYEILPFFWGQCSVPFAGAWFLLAGICILLDDLIRWKWFDEEQPYYTWRWTK